MSDVASDDACTDARSRRMMPVYRARRIAHRDTIAPAVPAHSLRSTIWRRWTHSPPPNACGATAHTLDNCQTARADSISAFKTRGALNLQTYSCSLQIPQATGTKYGKRWKARLNNNATCNFAKLFRHPLSGSPTIPNSFVLYIPVFCC